MNAPELEQNAYSQRDIRIGLITYDASHLKTEQVIHNLLRNGYKNIILFALPFKARSKREVLIEHRPSQIDSISTDILAKKNNFEFCRFNGSTDLRGCDIYLITGAGILAPEVIGNQKIINAHPGIIPASRGLDSFKWSIYYGVELGVTLHFIDKNVDSGEIIRIMKTPVYREDSIATLARRHYESEVDMLSNFHYHLSHPFAECFPTNAATRRMPIDIERVMCQRFDEYKEKYAK
jgi:phosphoribosylglycinamide formyltransferase-1